MRCRRRNGKGPLLLVLLTPWLVLRVARADESRAITIRYDAYAGCPSSARFVEQVRTRNAHVFDDPSASTVFEIRLRREAAGTAGRLTIRDRHAPEDVREVRGDSCSEVAAALALITAVLSDPEEAKALRSGAPSLESATNTPKSLPSGAPRTTELKSENPAATSASSSESSLRGPDSSDRREPEAGDRSRYRVAVGAEITAATGAAPSLAIGPRAYLELSRLGPSGLLPSGRLSAASLTSTTAETPAGSAEFSLQSGRLEACPHHFPRTGRWRAEPCALVDVGVLRGTGSGAVDATEKSALWLAVGASARIERTFFDRIRLEFEGNVFTTLRRDRFYFGPETTVHQVPSVGAALGAGLAVLFP